MLKDRDLLGKDQRIKGAKDQGIKGAKDQGIKEWQYFFAPLLPCSLINSYNPAAVPDPQSKVCRQNRFLFVVSIPLLQP
jgi:hypothetical protein